MSRAGSASARSEHRYARQRVADKSRLRRETAAYAAQLGLFFEQGRVLLAPALNGGFVALARTADGALTRPAETREQAADMRHMIGDAEVALDDLGHPGACPDVPAEAAGFGTLVEQAG